MSPLAPDQPALAPLKSVNLAVNKAAVGAVLAQIVDFSDEEPSLTKVTSLVAQYLPTEEPAV